MPRFALGIFVVGLLGASVGGGKVAEVVEIAKTGFIAFTFVMSAALVLGLARQSSLS